MIDGLHIHKGSKMTKPLAIALSGLGRGLWQGDGGGDLTNIQCKAIQNRHNGSPLYNEYMQIK
jgi:hypothetical protein